MPERPVRPVRPWLDRPVVHGPVELRNWPEHCGQRMIVERIARHRAIYCGLIRTTQQVVLRCKACGREGFRQDFDADPAVDRVIRQRMN